MRMGGVGSASSTSDRCAMICGAVSVSNGLGSALIASTSPSSPGYVGVSTRKPLSW